MVGFVPALPASRSLRGCSLLGPAAFADVDVDAALVEVAELDVLELVLLSLPPQAPSVVPTQTAATTAITGRCQRCIVTPSGLHSGRRSRPRRDGMDRGLEFR